MNKFLKSSLILGMIFISTAYAKKQPKAPVKTQPLTWSMADEILKKIHDPVFSNYSVNINDMGAVSDDDKLDTKAIQAAIDKVSKAGGGIVIVPAGVYDTGAITLKNNVNLHLEDEKSVLKFTKTISHDNYPMVFAHYEGSKVYNWSPFIYAYGQKNIAVTGKGTLDGQADKETWWDWKRSTDSNGKKIDRSSADAKVLRKMTDDGVPAKKRVFGEGHYLRPNFVQPIECTNVLIEGVTFKNSPMWILNPVLCTNFTARGVHIDTHGYNNDGCDPENCNYVLIENCYFNTGDDCIAIKAGRNRDGRELGKKGFPTQNLVIRNNTFQDGHGGIACGSEMSGGIKNVFADNNVFDSPTLNYALRFKTNAERGGSIENVYLRNSTVKSVGNAVVHATMLYDVGRDGKYLPQFKNIKIENLKSSGGEYGIFMEAFNEVPITGLVLENIDITNVKKDIRALNWKDPKMINVTINGNKYPRPIDTKVLGFPVVGNKVEGTSVLLGGNNNDLSYEWEASDTKDGKFSVIGQGKDITVPNDNNYKYLKLTATDKTGNKNESIAYKILTDNKAFGTENDKVLLKAISKGYIDPNEQLDLNKKITHRECAVMIAKLWGLTAPTKEISISDVPADDKDYNAIAAVVESGMMGLKDPNVKGAQGTLYNAGVSKDEGNKRTAFMPDEPVAREEMGYIALLSCGVPYNETLGTKPKFEDSKNIEKEYKTNVGASAYFGFVKAKEGNKFMPKDDTTMRELINVIVNISDFVNK